MTKPIIVSVVRDFAMYDKCLGKNPNCQGCTLAPLDNRVENEGVSKRYNEFLASRPADEEAWYIFCHEDFELLEPLLPRLEGLDKSALWGVIGAKTKAYCSIYHHWQLLGKELECNKDGSNEHFTGHVVSLGTPVETFDCQCLIVHSSLIKKYNLRFDENLTFDLYVEDFCIAAAGYGVVSRVLLLVVRHWSRGNVLERYHKQEAYLAKKYPNLCSTGTCSWILGGNPPLGRRLTVALKRLVLLLYKNCKFPMSCRKQNRNPNLTSFVIVWEGRVFQ